MKRGLIASLGALLSALLAVSLIAAQGSYPLNDTFDTTASGWVPTLHISNGMYLAYATITWLSHMELTTTWPPSITAANGVIKIEGTDTSGMNLKDIQKNVYLQTGYYQVKMRAGSDQRTMVEMSFRSGVAEHRVMLGYLDNQFTEETSDVFNVVSPGPVTIIFRTDNTAYIDWIRIETYTGQTPTPYTTLVVTPIPTNQQATPMPVLTQYCQPPTPTPGPADFDVTPTATPDTSGDWKVVDTFSDVDLYPDWGIAGAGATVNLNISGPDTALGVLEMPFSSNPTLVLQHDISPTVYVDGWAMANALPIGSTAAVNVVLWDGPTYGWVAAGSQEFGVGQWYPFHITVTDPGLHSLPSTALAIYISGPSGDKAYLDNIDIYNSLRGAPLCGFTPATLEEVNEIHLVYPWDKPCPSDTSGIQDVPNNFWGPLFFWMGIQFLQITAPFPVHAFQGYALAIQQFGTAPFWRYVQTATMMFDLRPMVAMAILLMVLEGVRLIYSAWRLLLKIIPMMG